MNDTAASIIGSSVTARLYAGGKISVKAVPSSNVAKVSISGVPQSLPAKEGYSIGKVIVTAENGDQKEYELKIEVHLLSSNSLLEAIVVNGTSYKVSNEPMGLILGNRYYTLSFITQNDHARASISGSKFGRYDYKKTEKITVTAEDGTSRDYDIQLIVQDDEIDFHLFTPKRNTEVIFAGDRTVNRALKYSFSHSHFKYFYTMDIADATLSVYRNDEPFKNGGKISVGKNTFHFITEDKYGNKDTYELVVIRDSFMPSFLGKCGMWITAIILAAALFYFAINLVDHLLRGPKDSKKIKWFKPKRWQLAVIVILMPFFEDKASKWLNNYDDLLDELEDRRKELIEGISVLKSYQKYAERLEASKKSVKDNIQQYNESTRALIEAKMAVAVEPDLMEDMYDKSMSKAQEKQK